MKLILLITEKDFDTRIFEKVMQNYGQVSISCGDRCNYYVKHEKEYVAIDEYGREGVFYEIGELDEVGFENPRFFGLEYTSVGWMTPILKSILEYNNNIWVDNDRYLISGKSFLDRINKEPHWNFIND